MKEKYRQGGRVWLLGIVMMAMAVLVMTGSVKARAASAFDITKYHVDMKVTKDNVYKITETIEVNFKEERHGIYRNIPLVNRIKREDGSEGVRTATVRNISCGSDNFESSRENDACQIKIGDEDETIEGKHEYQISYDYCLSNDIMDGKDELYMNVIGGDWDDSLTISNISFQIEMPDKFDEQKLGMCYGPAGSTNYDGLSYAIDGNTIMGELDSDITLGNNEYVTVRLELPDGYFNVQKASHIWPNLCMIIAVLGAVLLFALWWIYGRDDPVVETVEFHAPDGMNSLDVAFAYKGEVDNSDVVSLVVYLAQKGYLTIKQTENSFILKKNKDYDGLNEDEAEFLRDLFKNGSSVTRKGLEDSFYKTIDSIMGRKNHFENRKVLFHENSINKSWIHWVVVILSFLALITKPVGDYEMNFLAGLFVAVGTAVANIFLFYFAFRPGKKFLLRCVLIPIGTVFADFLAYLLFLQETFETSGDRWYVIAFWTAVVCAGIMTFFSCYLSKRTEYGTQILGRILGFKNFLETVEKDRLEAMVQDDPEYFYEILPYTYVLDISDKWIKKFESIAIEAPDWYSGYNNTVFDYYMFSHFMHSTMESASTAMTSQPSSSSGGGFSGGGSGGGGGGSW